MQQVCPNCGDPVEQDELFCDKCGTKVGPDSGESAQYQVPAPNEYQTPTPNPYQNQYQTPPTNINQNQYSYFPGQQQNMPPYSTTQSYPPPAYNQYQKPKTGSKVLKIVFITISVAAVLIVALGIIGLITEDKDKKTTNNNTNSNTKPPVSEVSRPATTESKSPSTEVSKPAADNTKPTSGQMLVTWDGNIDVNANYKPAEKKIYVDYSIALKNIGKGSAQNINVYLDPDPNDENAKYLGMKPKTIVNYEGIVKQINAGSQQQVKTQFFYSNIEAANAGQSNLQDIANRYLKLPVLIEWEENGKKFNDRKVPH